MFNHTIYKFDVPSKLIKSLYKLSTAQLPLAFVIFCIE